MDLYTVFNHYEADLVARTNAGGAEAPFAVDDWWAVTAGGRINF
jgi:hypothetical protein